MSSSRKQWIRAALSGAGLLACVTFAGSPAWGQTLTPGGAVYRDDLTLKEPAPQPAPQPAPAPAPAIDVDKKIEQLGSPSYREREKAMKELLDAARNGQLTPEQINKIRDAMNKSPDPEIRWRAEWIIKRYVATVPAVKSLLELLQVEITRQIRISTNFDFLGMMGWLNHRPQAVEDFNKLMDLASRARSALLRGDTEGAKKYLNDLKDFIKNLPKDRFDELHLRANGQHLTQQQVIDIIDGVITNQIPKAENGIQGKLEVAPAPRPKVGIAVPGPLDTGGSIRIDVATVTVPGTAELTTALNEDGARSIRSDAPDGYEFVGHVFDLLPDEGLQISGTVLVAIQYDAEPTDGLEPSPAVDPSQLQIVRVANENVDLLPVVAHDAVNGVIYAEYEADTGGFDPFGMFALVQPVPTETVEPAP